MNSPPDISLHTLQLLRLVAEARSFTVAAEQAGISQSALSRQVQSAELRLGVQLLDRTTRKVSLTEAGAILLRETASIPNILTGALRRIQEECLGVPREIRIGLSTELALAHIPGLFHAHQQATRDVRLVVSQDSEKTLLDQAQNNSLDLAILTKPETLPQAVKITHEMEDLFCLITPPDSELASSKTPAPQLRSWSVKQQWLLPSTGTSSRHLIDQWITKQKWKVAPHMELESFDLMLQLVALGMGSTIAPRRALSNFPRKHLLQKISLPRPLSRRLVAIAPRFSRIPEHVNFFVHELLFS